MQSEKDKSFNIPTKASSLSAATADTTDSDSAKPIQEFQGYLALASGRIDEFKLVVTNEHLQVITLSKGKIKTSINLLEAHVKMAQIKERDNNPQEETKQA